MTQTTPGAIAPEPPEQDRNRIDVSYVAGEAYTAYVRGHRLHVDQPAEAGGDDTAPNPTELFAASLATCVAF